MGWYQVIKTINGRRYVYLQMTYREGGKVKTKNKYLGPASSAGALFGFGAPADLPIAQPRTPTPARSGNGGLRVTKIRRLKPKTRAAMWREANKWRLEQQAHYNAIHMREARKDGDLDEAAALKEDQAELRKLHKLAFGSRLKLTKKGRRIIVARHQPDAELKRKGR